MFSGAICVNKTWQIVDMNSAQMVLEDHSVSSCWLPMCIQLGTPGIFRESYSKLPCVLDNHLLWQPHPLVKLLPIWHPGKTNRPLIHISLSLDCNIGPWQILSITYHGCDNNTSSFSIGISLITASSVPTPYLSPQENILRNVFYSLKLWLRDNSPERC